MILPLFSIFTQLSTGKKPVCFIRADLNGFHLFNRIDITLGMVGKIRKAADSLYRCETCVSGPVIHRDKQI